jgi:hypothetical protein
MSRKRPFPKFGVFQENIKGGSGGDKKTRNTIAEIATEDVEAKKPPEWPEE